MSFPVVRMKLKPDVKRAFLEHMYRQIRSEFWLGENSQIGVRSVFRSFAISKSFMDCSRQHGIYRLNLNGYELDNDTNEDLNFCISNPNWYLPYFPYLGLNIRLPLAKAQKMLGFLKPKFFGVHYIRDEFEHISLAQTIELIRITDGKIGLFFYNVGIEDRFVQLLRTFAPRLNELKCNAILCEDKQVKKMTLDSCSATSLKRQLKDILRHDMKQLVLTMDPTHYSRDTIFDLNGVRKETVRNMFVEKVRLYATHCNYVDQIEVIVGLLQFCPNLKEFDLDVTFPIERRDFEFQYIVDQTLIHRDQMNDIKNSYLAHLAKKAIWFNLEFTRNSTGMYDHSWLEQVQQHFLGWDIRKYYYYDLDAETNDFTVNFMRHDLRCSLYFQITLTWAGERNEELALEYLLDDVDEAAGRGDHL